MKFSNLLLVVLFVNLLPVLGSEDYSEIKKLSFSKRAREYQSHHNVNWRTAKEAIKQVLEHEAAIERNRRVQEEKAKTEDEHKAEAQLASRELVAEEAKQGSRAEQTRNRRSSFRKAVSFNLSAGEGSDPISDSSNSDDKKDDKDNKPQNKSPFLTFNRCVIASAVIAGVVYYNQDALLNAYEDLKNNNLQESAANFKDNIVKFYSDLVSKLKLS